MTCHISLFRDVPTPWDCPALTEKMIVEAENKLRCRLPASYVAALRERNGGLFKNCHVPVPRPDESTDHLNLFGLLGVGDTQGIDGPIGNTTLSAYLVSQWNYPPDAVVFWHGGHDGFLFDYSHSGRDGEPRIIFADAEMFPNTRIALVAPNFQALLESLY